MKTIFSAPDSGSFRCDLASLSVFTKQLAVLVGSGVPLHEALDSLIEDEEARTIGSLIVPELRYAITNGHSFSSSLSRFPLVFPKTYVALIRGAEETGKIGDVLDRLGLWLEAQNRIRMEVKKALTYPAFVIALTGFMTFVLFKTIVPEILKTVVELGADLPPPTRALMGVVSILDSPLFWFLVLNLVAATVWYLRTEDGYRKFLYLCNAMPVLGPILLVSNGAKYALSLSMLLGSGVDILKSTALAAEASGSPFHKWDFKRMLRALREGEALGEALSCSPFYPQLLVDMVKVGDQTGEMAGLLGKCAEMLEDETRQRLEMLVNLLEPIVLGAVSCIVGGIMVAIMMPMANLISAL